MQENNKQMTDKSEYGKRYLEFSCQKLEFSVKPGENVEGNFEIISSDEETKGCIYSSDTRMKSTVLNFQGKNVQIPYLFQSANLESGNTVRGEFVIISNQGEYTLPYHITVQKPMLQSSMGNIKNIFHFTNLAKSNWQEAVELFYQPHFTQIFHKNEKELFSIYVGLSRMQGSAKNVEEFLISSGKKSSIIYTTDVEGFELKNIVDSTAKTITITKKGWGYTDLNVRTVGEFIQIPSTSLKNDDFAEQICAYTFVIDAIQLHAGLNVGKIIIEDTCNRIEIPIHIMMHINGPEIEIHHRKQQVILRLMNAYVERKLNKISQENWLEKSEDAITALEELEPQELMVKLYRIQLLLTKECFAEAKNQLDLLEKTVETLSEQKVAGCYYLYLTTLYNRDESYLEAVADEIETVYGKNPTQWRLALLLLYADEEYVQNPQAKWKFLEELFKQGCASPVLLSEAVVLLKNNPSFLLRLGNFEQNVLWFAAKHGVLRQDMIEQIHYLAARMQSYSELLFRILSKIYEENQSVQTVAAICRLLILGDKKGPAYFSWYEKGVDSEVRVTKLYEYYMMSIDLDKQCDIPKMVLMYFAYQSNLDYERNAFLYAYVVRMRDKYPQLEQSYRIAMERFIMDQIKAGHINENLAYLYQNVLAPQMLRDETAYAFTPLLFTHKLIIPNEKIVSVVVVHEKINGESIYPVSNRVCMLPIYGGQYKLFLQDEQGSRYVISIPYENIQLMEPQQLIPFIGSYMEGRLSFDIYQCETDDNYITITADNLKRFQNLAESEQVISSFKKEIRTKLLHYYYDNDMIGELDTFLEETEADDMEDGERAEFIRFLISRGMFEKAYLWMKRYGMSGVNQKSVARLVTKRIVTNQYMKEDFLVNVAFYIYKNLRYDEQILQYLMQYYEGTTKELKNIWKSAKELELPTAGIQYRILKQMQFTQVIIPERYEILLCYEKEQNHDDELVRILLQKAAKEYFADNVVVEDEVLIRIYERYRKTSVIDEISKLALLRFWAENPVYKLMAAKETIITFAEEFLQKDIYFPFFKGLSDIVPQLHYFKDKVFVEYRTNKDSIVKIHYVYGNEEHNTEVPLYETEEMKEMYSGIYVKSFSLFNNDTLLYYISEKHGESENVTLSNTLEADSSIAQSSHLLPDTRCRYSMLDDIFVSMNMHDDKTTKSMLEEYLQEDFCARELFRVI